MGVQQWLDQGKRRNLLWAVLVVLFSPVLLALLGALWLGFVLLGVALGLWPAPFDH